MWLIWTLTSSLVFAFSMPGPYRLQNHPRPHPTLTRFVVMKILQNFSSFFSGIIPLRTWVWILVADFTGPRSILIHGAAGITLSSSLLCLIFSRTYCPALSHSSELQDHLVNSEATLGGRGHAVSLNESPIQLVSAIEPSTSSRIGKIFSGFGNLMRT